MKIFLYVIYDWMGGWPRRDRNLEASIKVVHPSVCKQQLQKRRVLVTNDTAKFY